MLYVFIHDAHVNLVQRPFGQPTREARFPTTGRDDPRIQEAITRCRAAGYLVLVYS